jgi:hypothetical protein
MQKPIQPTSIKFTPEQRKFLKQRAKDQRHHKISKVVKALVDREMVAGGMQ